MNHGSKPRESAASAHGNLGSFSSVSIPSPGFGQGDINKGQPGTGKQSPGHVLVLFAIEFISYCFSGAPVFQTPVRPGPHRSRQRDLGA